MRTSSYLAFDLGAESGRAVLGSLEGGRLSLREIHRFPNGPIEVLGGLFWDVYALFEEMKTGLTKAVRDAGPLRSAAVDSWGVDFGYLAPDGSLLGLPRAYRDARNAPAMRAFLGTVPPERLYEMTGLQLLPFNSLFQIQADVLAGSSALRAASRILFIPGLMSYFLSGAAANDTTVVSTSGLVDPVSGDLREDLFDVLGVPAGLLDRPVPPGTILGALRSDVRRATGSPETPVIAAAGHDTASAVAAVPAEGGDAAFLSSGTWSLLGIETDRPIITPESRRANFTNEGGLGGRVRFLKNISGLWILQRCRARWLEDGILTYEEIRAEAEAASPFRSLIDPDDPEFLNPPDMLEAIRNFCRRTGQPAPATRAETARCVLESLALKYRAVLADLRAVSGRTIRRIHVIGGGSRNGLLNEFTAAATGLPVIAGPVEATAAGNILIQALAMGDVGSVDEIRAVIARSTDLRSFEPRETKSWEAAAARFDALVKPGDMGRKGG